MSEDRLRCLFCLEEIDRTDSPRRLPCGQIGCLQCLRGSLSQPCVCGLTHDIKTVYSLPAAPPSTKRPSDDLPGDTPQIKRSRTNTVCDNCVDSATCYCVYCVKKLCPQHEQVHRTFFSSNKEVSETHKVISIDEYDSRPNFFIRPQCEEHREALSICCTVCYSMRCAQCSTKDRNENRRGDIPGSSGTGARTGVRPDQQAPCYGNHKCVSLKDTEIILTAEFETLLQTSSKDITELCRKEKSAWNKLDSLEEKCQNIVKSVKTKTENLVSTLNTLGDRFVEKINIWSHFKRQEIEHQLLAARNLREKFPNKLKDYRKFVSENHITELVNQRDHLMASLQINSSRLLNCDFSLQQLKDVVDGYQKLDVSSCFIPNIVKRVKKFETRLSQWGPCRSLSIIGNDTLLTLRPNSIRITPSVMSAPDVWGNFYDGKVNAMATTDEHIYFLRESEMNVKSVQMMDAGNALASYAVNEPLNIRELFTLDIPIQFGIPMQFGGVTTTKPHSSNSLRGDPNPSSGLYASRDYVIVVSGNMMVAYHMNSKEQCRKRISRHFTHLNVSLCEDDSLLVLFKPSNILLKYVIIRTETEHRIEERPVSGLNYDITDMCPYGGDGYLANLSSEFRVISKEGKLVKRLSHDHKMDRTIQMVSKGDLLATLNGDNSIGIFHLLL